MSAYHRQKGSTFERMTADYLAEHLDDRIDRRVKTGAADKGDIGGVRVNGQRIAIECKNVATMALPQWTREARQEAVNDGAAVGVVVHKRRGSAKAGEQWVSMTLEDLVTLLKLVQQTS